MSVLCEKRNLCFIDAETDGLQGPFISVAMIITDCDGNEIKRYYWGIQKEYLCVSDPWTREHVLPIMGDYVSVPSETDLLETVWKVWRDNADAYVIGDVIFPVEARLFQKCIDIDPLGRKFQGPYPFLDISSIIYARGYSPDISRMELLQRLYSEEEWRAWEDRQHNALFDVEMTILLFKALIKNG